MTDLTVKTKKELETLGVGDLALVCEARGIKVSDGDDRETLIKKLTKKGAAAAEDDTDTEGGGD